MAAKKMGRCLLGTMGVAVVLTFSGKRGDLAGRSSHTCEPLLGAVVRVSASDRLQHTIVAIGPKIKNFRSNITASDCHRICAATC